MSSPLDLGNPKLSRREGAGPDVYQSCQGIGMDIATLKGRLSLRFHGHTGIAKF